MTPEDIVRALAAIDDPMVTDDDGIWSECGICEHTTARDPGSGPEFHDDGCPWRMARLWVADNPAPIHDQEAE